MKGLSELVSHATWLLGERDAEPDDLSDDVSRWEWEGGALAGAFTEERDRLSREDWAVGPS